MQGPLIALEHYIKYYTEGFKGEGIKPRGSSFSDSFQIVASYVCNNLHSWQRLPSAASPKLFGEGVASQGATPLCPVTIPPPLPETGS